MAQLRDLGYQAEVVDNGVEALEALDRQSYHVVLMDCQMPGLDGYQTTRRIWEREAGPNRLPVVAVTAHAMKGERERCLAAGMDDYLVKPFSGEQLAAVIDRWLATAGPPAAEGDAGLVAPGGSDQRVPESVAGDLTLDPAQISSLRQLSSEAGEAVLDQLVDLFRRDSPRRLKNLRKALAEDDRSGLERVAHSFMGSSGTLGASRLQRLCGELARLAEDEAADGFEARLDTIEEELRRVMGELEKL